MARELSYVAKANRYIRAVVSGKIPACTYVRQACQRQLNDLEKSKSPDWPYRFDHDKANRPCRYAERLPHVKGPKARDSESMVLEDWQCFIRTTVFGWVHKRGPKAGRRRFRFAYEEVPKGNGKSTDLSSIALYMLTADGEAGAEVYSAATSSTQARIVWSAARQMARRRPKMVRHFGLVLGAHAIAVPSTDSTFKPLSSAADQIIEGSNPHCAVIDELHAHRTAKVFDNMETALGKRDQSLMFVITTAGDNRGGICYKVRSDVIKILGGVVEDDTVFGVIYTVDLGTVTDDGEPGDDGDDPYAEETWRKANPNYAVSVDADHIARMAAKARRSPAERAKFFTKHLNIWINSYQALFDIEAWSTRCKIESLDIEDFKGQACYSSADLASKTDLASRCKLFVRPGEWKDPTDGQVKVVPFYYVFGTHYVPRRIVDDSTHIDYTAWELDEKITVHEGDVTDFELIQADIEDDARDFEIAVHGYDAWQSHQMATSLQNKGLQVMEMPQQVRTLSAPTKELMALILQGRIKHDGDPVLAMAISNVVGKFDRKDNVFPTKEGDDKKIDPAIAVIMALAFALQPETGGPSVYEERGLLEVEF